MKVIAVEEHFAPAAVLGITISKGLPPLEQDVGMDEDGVSAQVISTPFAQGFGPDA